MAIRLPLVRSSRPQEAGEPAPSPQTAAQGALVLDGSPPAEAQGAPAIGGLKSTTRTFGRNSLIYFIAEGGVRAATLLVVPLYTRALTPRDYGILAVTSSATLVVTLLLGLSLDDALGRLTLELDSEAERRRLYGTLLVFLLTIPLAIAVGWEVLGRLGYLNFFRSVPYVPYLRYAVWTGYLSAFSALPVTLYMATAQPRKVLLLRYLTIGVQVSVGITLIVVLHQGVLGALRAVLCGAAISAAVAVVLIARKASLQLSRRLLMASLAFCLPIVPHAIANWVLMLSDRVVLQRYVNDTQLGLYQLGYLVGGAAALFTNAAASAMAPIFYWRLRGGEDTRGQVPALGTYVFLALAFLCVLLAVFGGTAILVLTPASYAGATVIVPWIASSYIFVAAYILMTTGLWMAMQTRWLAVGTLLAAAVNLGATFLFGSIFGIVGAGVSTVIGYAFLALIQGIIARRLYPIPWEYERWVKILVVAGACLAAGLLAGDAFSPVSIALRLCIMGIGFPLGLHVVGFWSDGERAEISHRRQALSGVVAARWRQALRRS